jgi:hypothetical protein
VTRISAPAVAGTTVEVTLRDWRSWETRIGTIGGAIAAQQRRDEYYDYYGPRYYRPGSYGYAPGYYGGGPYYGRHYYRYYPC